MFTVCACIGLFRQDLCSFEKLEDAEQFCEERNYIFIDENDFEWNMKIFKA